MRKNPVKFGYSLPTMDAIAKREIANGKTQKQANAIAYEIGRKAWKQRNKGKRMPEYLRELTKTSKPKAKPKAKRNPPIMKSPWVVQLINTKTKKHGWYTGTTIDSELVNAKLFRTMRSATIHAARFADEVPSPWVLVVTPAPANPQ